MSDEAGPRPEAGWYPDPEVPSGLRYWDGADWTTHRQPPAGPPPPPLLAPRADNGAAIASLVISIAGFFFTCMVLCPVGMILGRNEVQRIDRGEGDPAARGLAQAGYIIGAIGTALLALGIVFLAMIFALAAANT
ncbi:MAG: hypothetical protein DHS20C19_25490 [Acidimicrobiales bacterium]|nr:MAG: hypothetical protein DHS20C19_25490 [Acidimicrobiales bacterium]